MDHNRTPHPGGTAEEAEGGERKLFGLIAEFSDPSELLSVVGKLKAAGYRKLDSHTPFPIHGMDEALGESRSRVSYVSAGAALAGGLGIVALIWWVAVKAYPMVISGKPLFSYQAFFPVIFAITVLSAAFGSLIGFMGFMNLKLNHPLFNAESFGKFSDDGFLISVEAEDPMFDPEKTTELLRSFGASSVEQVGWDE